MIQPDPTIHRQVVSAARTLLDADPDAPIARIARQAGVSRATFYRHFGSREALLSIIAMDPPIPARERILEAAANLIGHGGLHTFSMEDVAVSAGVSRATVYRLFPTKAALFGEMVRHFSPFERVVDLITANRDQPPEVVVPLLARTIASIGQRRVGIMRAVLLEAAAVTPVAVSGIQPFMPEAIGALASYLAHHMETGRVRRMHPILAVQALMGPIFIHLVTRPIAERIMGFDMPIDEVVDELSATILGGLTP
jgi:AcrR family transcriptional regulator